MGLAGECGRGDSKNHHKSCSSGCFLGARAYPIVLILSIGILRPCSCKSEFRKARSFHRDINHWDPYDRDPLIKVLLFC